MPKYYPIYLNINARKCVVVGGGEVAYRKACGLQEAGGDVEVVSPEFCQQFIEKNCFTLKKKTI
ncbi:MAG: precorrin-2 dehydrogenase/sirohydrochlorin ferrochelatase family protein [Candidatus Anammoxibacter sp.]